MIPSYVIINVFRSAGDQMKRIYLVDSENVGDIWVPLLVASQPDEEVIVFYTQKSPHMNYENVRLLKETEKEAEFIKCFEGSNALDFQLVTQLGYMLCENQENCYVIVSNDTGFDAAVRYWKQRNMPVQRISGKELSRRLQQKTKTAELLENSTEAATGRTAEFLPSKILLRQIFVPAKSKSICPESVQRLSGFARFCSAVSIGCGRETSQAKKAKG